MRVIRDIANFPSELSGCAVSIGNFDGVHLGHAQIINRLVQLARDVGGPAVVFTFDPHPVRLLRPALAPPPLTWTDRKAQLVAEVGADAMIAYPTDELLLELSPQRFFDEIVRGRLAARAMVEGANFRFGHDRAGTVALLGELTERAGIELDVVEPVMYSGQPVSSSRVRRLLLDGDVEAARAMLTRPYRLRGMVTHGVGRGAKIGFPTANLEAIDTLLPGEGVYAARGRNADGHWPAAVNIGANPTFGETSKKVEVHLIDFDQDLYGQPLEVDFLTRLRDIQPFDNVSELKAQLARDAEAAAAIAAATKRTP